jgi:TRAP-type C4-dicarboxylate transport system permease small subunit
MDVARDNSLKTPPARSPVWRVLCWLDANLEFYVNFFLYSLLTTVIVVEVFRRYALDSATSYGEEVARYAFIWLAYLAAARGVRYRTHLSIDLIRDQFGRTGKFALFMLSDACFFILSAVIIWTGTRFVLTTIEFGQNFTGIDLPLWLAVAAIPVGWTIIAFRIVQRCLLTIAAYRRGEPMTTGFIGSS